MIESIFRAAPIGIGVVTNRVLGEVNDRLCQMTGYTRDELIGQSSRILYPSDEDFNYVGKEKYRQIRKDGTGSVETRFRRKDGTTIAVLLSSTPIDVSDLSRGVTFTALDITDRKRIEEQLRESEFFFRESQREAFIGSYKTDFTTDSWVSSEVLDRIFGIDRSYQRSVHGWLEIVHPDDRAMMDQYLRDEVFAEHKPFSREYRIIRKSDGETRWVNGLGRVSFDNEGHPISMIGTIQDITEHKRANENLKALSKRQETLLAAIPDIIMEVNKDKVYTWANSAGIAFFGSDVLGKEASFYFEGEQDTYRAVQPLFNGHEEVFYVESWQRRKDGEKRLLAWWCKTLKDKNGRVSGAISSARDITDHMRADQALQKSEEKYRSLIENLPDIISHFDRQGRQNFVSPSVTALMGRPPSDFIGKTLMEADLPPELGRRLHGYIQSVFETGEPVEAEVEFTSVRGPVIILWRLTPVPATEGGEPSVLGIAHDVTERRKAQQSYRMLFHEMLDGFALHEIICDEKGNPVNYRFLAVNPAFEKMTKLKAENIIGKTVLEVMPHTEHYWIETYGRVALTGEPIFFENYAHAFDRHFEVHAFRPTTGQFACVFADITDRKRAEIEREKLQSKLFQAQKMESIGRLAGGVAHDFNNMLGVILGRVDLALEEIEPKHPIREDLEEIQKAAKRSADLTRQLLGFARKQTATPVILDTNEELNGMLKMLSRLIGEDIDLAWKPGKNTWSISMDPGQLDQVLANLAVNARDAITGVGKLTIETQNITFDRKYCDLHPDAQPGDYVMLAVTDTGSGIDKETYTHLFEPFFTTKEVGKGVGLGLATVYGIVKQNHGFINVYSEPKRGTSFKIYLPRAKDGSKSHRHASERKAEHGTETILLVEDEGSILSLGKLILERHGYTVLTAGDPEKAISLMQKHQGPIHLLITDVVMPHMNGKQLSQKIAALHPGIRTLYMSGYTANVIAHQGVVEEGVRFLQKPFSANALSVKVREALDH